MLFFGNTYRALRYVPLLAGAAGGGLYFAAILGVGLSEGAWLWAIPFLFWSMTRPSAKQWLLVTWFAIWLAKIAALIWLRHVYPPLGWVALVFLTAAAAAFPFAWLALARWLFPRTKNAPVMARLVVQLGLAGAWVVLEWVQSWIFSGFPWMLLADTQWQQPAVLSLCAWGGPWALSFAIILFNVGLARYVLRFFEEREKVEAAELRERRRAFSARMEGGSVAGSGTLQPVRFPSPLGALRKVCPEFYLGVIPVFLAVFFFVRDRAVLEARGEKFFDAAVIQTDFDPNAKWNAALMRENQDAVVKLTLAASQLTKKAPVFDAARAPEPLAAGERSPDAPQLILWPEAALPFHITASNASHKADAAAFRSFLHELAKASRAALLIGAIGDDEQGKGYYNGIYSVTPDDGVETQHFYAKRHLVPFGEYVPQFALWLGVDKVVPVSQDCLFGTRELPLVVDVPVGNVTRTFRAGALVCYEDVFSDLGLDMARRGADFLAVVTNDAWYGREAGAYQHAAHSAVLAASLRIPVIRCGNNGWSGLFNPLGQQVPLRNAEGSIYFRGAGCFEVRGIAGKLREPTFYMTHGNWVVLFSGLLTFWAILRNKLRRKPARQRVKASEEEDVV